MFCHPKECCACQQMTWQQFLSLPCDVTNALGVKQLLQAVRFEDLEFNCHGNHALLQKCYNIQIQQFGDAQFLFQASAQHAALVTSSQGLTAVAVGFTGGTAGSCALSGCNESLC